MFPRLSILLIAFTIVFSPPICAKEAEQKQSLIKKITRQIKSIKASIKTESKKKGELESSLKQTESLISKSDKKLRGFRSDFKKQKRELDHLLNKKMRLEKNIEKQKFTLARQSRTSYLLGNQPYIKLILNQDDPKEISRQLKYFKHLNHARVKFIDELSINLNDLEDTQKKIAKKTKDQEKLLKQKEKVSNQLKKHEQDQKVLLANINKTLNSHDQELKELMENKHNLEKIVSKVSGQVVTKVDAKKSFSNLKGKLAWPTKGTVNKNFGILSKQTKIKYAGVFIDAPEKQVVHAVYPGKVVFSDWLRGFGSLIIIDHGQGYMSLYGHNRELLKQTGDPVEAGEPIASIGHTGGNQESGLYFEVRHNGRPENPAKWCV